MRSVSSDGAVIDPGPASTRSEWSMSMVSGASGGNKTQSRSCQSIQCAHTARSTMALVGSELAPVEVIDDDDVVVVVVLGAADVTLLRIRFGPFGSPSNATLWVTS